MALSQTVNEAVEPTFNEANVINLFEGGALDRWRVPSNRWYVEGENIVGNTGEEKLEVPEWLYTTYQFSDFEFTCELRLTGDNYRNTGIYFRANTFLFEEHQGNKSFEAPSGYEFDASFHKPNMNNFWGSLGDWYVRPSLRIFSDQTIVNDAYRPDDWNRITIRARENRLEYWINGIKVMDYLDHDPQASRNGVIGFQIHNGSVMKVEYRNIRVLTL